MKLFILRHGKAEVYQSNDFERVLTPEGIADIQKLGAQLKLEHTTFDHVLVSPYYRTQQTFRLLRNHAGIECEAVKEERLIPSSSSEQALEAIRHLSDDSNVLLVSHQPLVSSLVTLLIDNQSSNAHYYPMEPGAMAILDVFATELGCAILKSILSPPFYLTS